MQTQPTSAEWLLKDPRTRKWMQQCAGCQRWGSRHDAPSDFFGRAHLEKYFEALKVDERGICEQCRTVLS
jgi:hypothetical protein